MPRAGEPTRDAAAPPFGPPFLRFTSSPYRVEMAAATVVLLVMLFYWRGVRVGGLDVPLTVFWLIWPDLAAFVPIGVAARRGGPWPSWGPALYNAAHSFLVWGGAFGLASLLAGEINRPLLGWAAHLTADRAAGYYLRAPRAPSDRSGASG